jgi:hypothetical protein
MALMDPIGAYADLDTSSLDYAPDFSTAGVRSWLRTRKMVDLMDFWNEARGARRCPGLDEIDHASVPLLASWLVVVARPVVGGESIVRYAGRRIIDLAGIDITGRPISNLPDPDYRRMFQENTDTVIRAGMPLASRYRRVLRGCPYEFERLDLPLTLESGRVGAVLVGMFATLAV